jgi:hypothetical protein
MVGGFPMPTLSFSQSEGQLNSPQALGYTKSKLVKTTGSSASNNKTRKSAKLKTREAHTSAHESQVAITTAGVGDHLKVGQCEQSQIERFNSAKGEG